MSTSAQLDHSRHLLEEFRQIVRGLVRAQGQDGIGHMLDIITSEWISAGMPDSSPPLTEGVADPPSPENLEDLVQRAFQKRKNNNHNNDHEASHRMTKRGRQTVPDMAPHGQSPEHRTANHNNSTNPAAIVHGQSSPTAAHPGVATPPVTTVQQNRPLPAEDIASLRARMGL